MLVFALAGIAWFYFTVRIKPGSKVKERSKLSRILFITGGVVLLALAWIEVPRGSIAPRVLLSLFAFQGIYRGLDGWLFNAERV
ncbi:MAG: hypothetical protein R6V75_08280 [Bacteroidales bacterium]